MTYADTSALAAFYFPEATTPAVLAALRTIEVVAISDLTLPEMASVASLKIRTGQLTAEGAREGLDRFERDVKARRYRRLTIRARHYRDARDRIARFAEPLRTLDALHLATAALAGAELLTLDRALARSAEAAGVAVVVPAGERQ